MGKFGWIYPAGCSGPPDDHELCDTCGNDWDWCTCPECPECGATGDPSCYTAGHMPGPPPERVEIKKDDEL